MSHDFSLVSHGFSPWFFALLWLKLTVSLLNLDLFCGDKWPHYRDEPILEAANKALWPSICQGGKDPMHDMNGAVAREKKKHRAFGWNAFASVNAAC